MTPDLISNRKTTMTELPNNSQYYVACYMGQQGARSLMGSQVRVEKLATGLIKENQILKHKCSVNIATFNSRTTGTTKLNKLTALSEKYKLEVTCIQEHRIYHHDDHIKYHDMGKGWKLVSSAAEQAQNNSSNRGVGMLLSPTVQNHC